MGELIRYENKPVKLGTCESLYYTSIQKYVVAYTAGKLGWLEGNLVPSEYLNVEQGFMFRFPFPDEDKLPFCEIIEPFNRSVPVSMSRKAYDKLMGGDHGRDNHVIGIEFQKMVNRQSDGKKCLALVFRDHLTDTLYRVEDDPDMKLIIKEIIRNHISGETDQVKKSFYKGIAGRILKGYRLDRAISTSQEGNKAIEALPQPGKEKKNGNVIRKLYAAGREIARKNRGKRKRPGSL